MAAKKKGGQQIPGEALASLTALLALMPSLKNELAKAQWGPYTDPKSNAVDMVRLMREELMPTENGSAILAQIAIRAAEVEAALAGNPMVSETVADQAKPKLWTPGDN